jgi:hypothetical protein
MSTIVKVCSHQAKEKLRKLIGHKAQGYFSWDREGAWYECPPHLLQNALKIDGIKLAKIKPDLVPNTH